MKNFLPTLVIVTILSSFLTLSACGGNVITKTTTGSTTTATSQAIQSIVIKSDEQFTGANGVASGSGSQSDPYIIEGLTINYLYDAITISSTTKYFVIRDCQIKAGQYGVSLSTLSNGKVENCVFTDCGLAIWFGNCSEILLSGNTMENCGVANQMPDDDSKNVIISNNTITGSQDCGIELRDLTNSTLTGNIIKNNNSQGIDMFQVTSCTVSGNTCTGNRGGISISGSDNTIDNNDASNNGYGIGASGNGNIITYNTCNNNTYTGIDTANGGGIANGTISNNTANNNGTVGILFDGRDCTVNKNTCLSNFNKDFSIPWDFDGLGNIMNDNNYVTLTER